MSLFSHESSFYSYHNSVKLIIYWKVYTENGIWRSILFTSTCETISPYLFLPFAFFDLSERRCFLHAFPSLIFPDPVTLSRFFTPLRVFNIIGIIKNYFIGLSIAWKVFPIRFTGLSSLYISAILSTNVCIFSAASSP